MCKQPLALLIVELSLGGLTSQEKGDDDPTYAETLKEQCSNQVNPSTTVEMEPQSSLSFDIRYFSTVNQNKGLFQSDAALLMKPNFGWDCETVGSSPGFFRPV